MALLILVSGFRNYVRLQRVMWIAILVAFATMLLVLITTSPRPTYPARSTRSRRRSAARRRSPPTRSPRRTAAGVDLNPPFSLLATLLIAPIAWTSLQWATYSSQQNGEIKSAGSFRDQAFIIVGSLILTGLLLAAARLRRSRTRRDASSCTWPAPATGRGVGEATLAGSYLWPNIIATALANNPIVTLLIAFGFILNGHQIVHNCYIGMTRVMVAMSFDRLLPEWVSRVSDRLHTPVNAHVIYFLASIPVICLYNNFAYGEGDDTVSWASLTLGVTFACGYVFVVDRARRRPAAVPGARRCTRPHPGRSTRSAGSRW